MTTADGGKEERGVKDWQGWLVKGGKEGMGDQLSSKHQEWRKKRLVIATGNDLGSEVAAGRSSVTTGGG